MSIRTKLLLSYAAIVVLALFVAGAAMIAVRWKDSRQAAIDRLSVSVLPVSADVGQLKLQNYPQDQIREYIEQEAARRGVRILLVDRNQNVSVDTEDQLAGKTLQTPGGRPSNSFGLLQWDGECGNQRCVFVSFAGPLGERERRPGGLLGRPINGPAGSGLNRLDERVVLAVPEQTLARAWLGVLPGLAWAGLFALALSVVVAVALSRSIAHPLQALTHASEEMAKGNYDQEIAVRRSDEVGRLAAAFNSMAREVGQSHVQIRALIANVSHDLKTPLTSIVGFSQALRDGEIDEPAQVLETGGIIHEEAERVGALVNDLLFLSEIEARQVIVSREPLDLSSVVARVLRRFEPAMRAQGVAMTATVPEGISVIGDSAKLERVLDNLLDNARKYTPANGRVQVRLAADGPRIQLSVFNSGSYIAPEDLPRVFDRFFRLDRARSKASGSGLGLAIARELAELHGGTLSVQSDSTGTTFTLSLPRPPARLDERGARSVEHGTADHLAVS